MGADACVECCQALHDEFNPAVGARQGRQNVLIQDKNALYFVALGQGLRQGAVVLKSQVAPEPHQAFLKEGGGRI
jgi:hypothetical protein